MTMPSFFNCSPRSTSASTACAMCSFGLCLCFGWNFVIDLHARVRLDRADHLVTARDNLVTFLEAVQHFDVGGASDPRLHFAECCLGSRHDKYPLDFFLARLFRGRVKLRCLYHRAILRFGFEIAFLPDGQRLDGNCERPLASGSRDLGCAGKPWP